MTIVEQNRCHWAEPLGKGKDDLQLKQFGDELHITGLFPLREPFRAAQDLPLDLMGQYALAARNRAVGMLRTTEISPEALFANADTDAKLIAVVRRFGPVVAKSVYTDYEKVEEGLHEPSSPIRIFAVQDMQELRNEQRIYRCALALMKRLTEADFDYALARRLIEEISTRVAHWPSQWHREKAQKGREPLWNLSAESLKRIQVLSSSGPDLLLSPDVDGRIVLCELVNAFPLIVFPNPLEMHSSIKYGIRPLLYAILRRQFVPPRDLAVCANTQCRKFFNIERTGQQFCCAACSTHQRQRSYWVKRGKKLRKKRLKEKNKAKK
jgi:hypothetical protein